MTAVVLALRCPDTGIVDHVVLDLVGDAPSAPPEMGKTRAVMAYAAGLYPMHVVDTLFRRNPEWRGA